MVTSIVEQKILSELPQHIDYLIVCAGFEDRCLSMPQFLPRSRAKKIGVFSYLQFNEFSQSRKAIFRERFDAVEYNLDNSDPKTIADSLVDYFSDLDCFAYKPNLVVDISSFTRETMLIIQKFIDLNKESFSEICFFYRKAKVSDLLSDGILSVRSVIGYMGDFDPNKPIHLIVLSGFEYERAKGIIDIIEPSKISIGLGAKGESITEKMFEKNSIFTNKLMAYYSRDDLHIFEHSLIDYVKAKNKLHEIVDLYSGFNVVIAPLNNKISTFAAGMLGIEREEVQLCYSQMGNYNVSNYSIPIDDCIIITY